MASEAQPPTTQSAETESSQKALISQTSLPQAEKQAEKTEMPKIPACKQRLKERCNPFKMPRDCDIFALRDIEREEKRKEQEEQKKLKIYEKVTYTARVNAKHGKAQKVEEEPEVDPEAEHQANVKKLSALKSDPSWKVKVTRDRHLEKETLNDYINKKREMFTLQYSLTMKKDEIRKLEEAAAAEELKLQMAERYLEEDAAMFDEFLKENDKNSVQAMQIAEKETKLKLEKVSEMKKLTTQMMAVKNDIVKFEETLKDYRMYRDFLMKLSPKEWREEKERQRKEIKLAKVSSREAARKPPPPVISRQGSKIGVQSVAVMRSVPPGSKTASDWRKTSAVSIKSKSEEHDWSDSDEEPELYFTDPKQLLAIYTELEEQNLSLILNSQETEEAVEEIKQAMVNAQQKMNCETDFLKQQLNLLNEAVAKEESRAAELELKAKMFSFSQSTIEDQDKMLEALDQKVMEVYRSCIGDNEANMTTLQMLTSIENYLEDLFENLEKLPREKVELAEKNKEKERRMRLREEKLREEKLHQEERIHRAMMRSQAEHQKKMGRKLVYRSEPPLMKELKKQVQDTTDQQAEEDEYYFSF
ncbi:cilia- and flagella-associated protein 100 isoform X1 [Pristis pectinata]|uniref:cilia- and flagella-associated protein 100 isoform X1 n=1 Tax=Pristis pectinata TaxID=685728 RepID=UPI00223D2062|nr:cilia- and flagella-associated protein 100 isoform X1 [Pristis pectinata]XP_051873429.1 cilia- and flagella-associated protein 100 isoform X2 [Pristis pectinata]XP_051873430.1 cilia- and flagella-associated protein 100 isoform X1 [Pristis pectinata]